MLQAFVVMLPLLSAPQDRGLTEQEAVALAKQAVNEETGVGEAELERYQVLPAQWRDSSLGCPNVGEAYLPVMTRGYRVFLKAGDEPSKLHEVRIAPGQAVLCETADPNVAKTMPKAEGNEFARELKDAPTLARLARQDLASRLGVDEAEIQVSVNPRTWPDTSLGCPQPSETYENAWIDGFLITLEVDEEVYEYHADKKAVLLCEEPAPDHP